MLRKLTVLFTLVTIFTTCSFAQKRSITNWVNNFCNGVELVSESTQSRKIRKVLIEGLDGSSIVAKKTLREMDISPKEIEILFKRFSQEDVSSLIKKIDKLGPRATRLLLKDLARNGDSHSKSLLIMLKREPRLIKSYERISINFSVKFRTDIGVLRQVAQGKKPVKLKTRYGHMEGKTIKGVPYVRRKFSVNGVVYEGVFPDFKESRKFYSTLPRDFIYLSGDNQMKKATKQLRSAIKRDPSIARNFTPEQLEAINRGDIRIPDLTWHHKESPIGAMELVPFSIHNNAKHDGGVAIWNAGIR
ncbi:MAG: HNH endonuclease [Labilibaculum sp.]|nr:HNH endonuclease [Labilibaculum sp.]MBI9056973.1 HNH endonuclease [Labilibaculum sp.]